MADDSAVALMDDDAWHIYVRREAALEIGHWLEESGKLQKPISSLTLKNLEAMADNAISKWIVLQSMRLQERPAQEAKESIGIGRLLLSG